MYLMMLDGAWAFTRLISGAGEGPLSRSPSDYFRRQVRVASFAYEAPATIAEQLGGTDLLMCCSDYPHAEGTATPLADYAASGLDSRTGMAPGLFSDNVAFLLRKH